MKRILFIFLIFPGFIFSQVTDVEKLRMRMDTSGFYGGADFGFEFKQEQYQSLIFGLKVHSGIKFKRNSLLGIANIVYEKRDSVVVENEGYIHLRYNYEINKKFTIEAFGQTQYYQALGIDNRYLVGAGLRIDLYKELYSGTILMYEYEKQIAEGYPIERNIRISQYFSKTFEFTENFKYLSILYYQPKINEFDDYRFFFNNIFLFKVIKNLGFNFGISFLYDSKPAHYDFEKRIPNLVYKTRFGISIKF